jgi:hypothetical protein
MTVFAEGRAASISTRGLAPTRTGRRFKRLRAQIGPMQSTESALRPDGVSA